MRIFFSAIALCLIVATSNSYACSPSPSYFSKRDSYDEAKFVGIFEIEAIDIKTQKLTLKVLERFKGRKLQTLRVQTAIFDGASAACGFEPDSVKVGMRMIAYLGKAEGKFILSTANRITSANNRKELVFLNKQ